MARMSCLLVVALLALAGQAMAWTDLQGKDKESCMHRIGEQLLPQRDAACATRVQWALPQPGACCEDLQSLKDLGCFCDSEVVESLPEAVLLTLSAAFQTCPGASEQLLEGCLAAEDAEALAELAAREDVTLEIDVFGGEELLNDAARGDIIPDDYYIDAASAASVAAEAMPAEAVDPLADFPSAMEEAAGLAVSSGHEAVLAAGGMAEFVAASVESVLEAAFGSSEGDRAVAAGNGDGVDVDVEITIDVDPSEGEASGSDMAELIQNVLSSVNSLLPASSEPAQLVISEPELLGSELQRVDRMDASEELPAALKLLARLLGWAVQWAAENDMEVDIEYSVGSDLETEGADAQSVDDLEGFDVDFEFDVDSTDAADVLTETVEALSAISSAWLDSANIVERSESSESASDARYSIQITEDGDAMLLPSESRGESAGMEFGPRDAGMCWHMALLAFVAAAVLSGSLAFAAIRMRRRSPPTAELATPEGYAALPQQESPVVNAADFARWTAESSSDDTVLSPLWSHLQGDERL